MTTTPTTFTIDCRTCPVRGRLCGDCFVPVLGRTWLQDPTPVAPGDQRSAGGAAGRASDGAADGDPSEGGQLMPPGGLALDSDELAAVSAFVRAGLVQPEEAARARAEPVAARSAAG